MQPVRSFEHRVRDGVQAVRCVQHVLKIGPADLIDEMQGDQCGPCATALFGGLLCLIGNCIDDTIGLGAVDHDGHHRKT